MSRQRQSSANISFLLLFSSLFRGRSFPGSPIRRPQAGHVRRGVEWREFGKQAYIVHCEQIQALWTF